MSKKYFSWSELSSWCYSQEEYIKQYIDGAPFVPNAKMKLGTIIHAAIEDPKYPWFAKIEDDAELEKVDVQMVQKVLRKLAIKRAEDREVPMTAKTPYGTSLFAIFDGFNRETGVLHEYKTTDKDKWNQALVDEHEQLSFYAYLYRLKFHGYFREMHLHAINVKKGTVTTFRTARGPKDIQYIADKIERVCDEIAQMGLWRKRLSRKEREKISPVTIPV